MADRMPDFLADFDLEEKEFAARIAPLPHSLPNCPEPKTLRALGQGVLPEDVEKAVESHVAGCALCRMLRADLDSLELPGLTSVERDRIRTSIPAAQTGRKTGFYVIAAAAATLLVAAGLFWGVLAHHESQQAAAPAPTQTPASVAAPAQPPLEVAKLAPPKLEPELIFRGAAETTDPSADDLAPALAAYQRNDYEQASARFAVLQREFPKSDIPPLYLGVSRLLAGKAAEAIAPLARAEALARASRHDARSDEAAWYHAVAANHLHAADAPALLDGLCKRGSSPYAHKACAAGAERK